MCKAMEILGMAKTFSQVRTDKKDKEQVSIILKGLGIYTKEEQISEVQATMSIEQMTLDNADIQLLKEYQSSKDREKIRHNIIESYQEDQ